MIAAVVAIGDKCATKSKKHNKNKLMTVANLCWRRSLLSALRMFVNARQTLPAAEQDRSSKKKKNVRQSDSACCDRVPTFFTGHIDSYPLHACVHVVINSTLAIAH